MKTLIFLLHYFIEGARTCQRLKVTHASQVGSDSVQPRVEKEDTNSIPPESVTRRLERLHSQAIKYNPWLRELFDESVTLTCFGVRTGTTARGWYCNGSGDSQSLQQNFVFYVVEAYGFPKIEVHVLF